MIILLIYVYIGMNTASPWLSSQGQGNTSTNPWEGEGEHVSQGTKKVEGLINLFSVSLKFA